MPTSNGNPGLVARVRERYRVAASMNPRWKGLRAYANWVRCNYEMWVGASRVKARPLKLTFDATNICQLHCPLCPSGAGAHDRERGKANLQLLQHVIDEVGDYVFFIDLVNWGEPLLNPQIEDFIKVAASKHSLCRLTTNLSLPLTDERIRRVLTSGLHEIVVSLDGASSATYSTYRRQGSFDLVYGNLCRMVRLKRDLRQAAPLITWQFIVFRFNEHEMETAKAMAAAAGVNRINFAPPFLDADRYPMSEEEKKEIAGWVPTNPAFHTHLAPTPSRAHSRCGWHYMSSAINWDGSVSPCSTTFKCEHDLGSLGRCGEHAYMEVVNNPAFRAVRDRCAGRCLAPLPLVCENCPTPSIRRYDKLINRQIVFLTAVEAIEAARRLFTIA